MNSLEARLRERYAWRGARADLPNAQDVRFALKIIDRLREERDEARGDALDAADGAWLLSTSETIDLDRRLDEYRRQRDEEGGEPCSKD